MLNAKNRIAGGNVKSASALRLQLLALLPPSALSLQNSAFPAVPPISDHGNVNKIIGKFGSDATMRDEIDKCGSMNETDGSVRKKVKERIAQQLPAAEVIAR